MVVNIENRIAIPADPLNTTLVGDWTAIDDVAGIQQVSGTGDDSTINETVANLYRTVNSQYKIIKDLLNQMRVAGYDIS